MRGVFNSTEFKETPNTFINNMKKTDSECEDSESRGKQPRSYIKVLKKSLSDKEVNQTFTAKR